MIGESIVGKTKEIAFKTQPDPTEQVETVQVVQQRPGSPRPDPTEQVIVTYWHTFTDIPGKSIIST